MQHNSTLARVLIIGAVLTGIAGGLSGATAQEVPQCIKDWTSQGKYIEFNGHQLFIHASGPKSNEGVLIVHGYPGSS